MAMRAPIAADDSITLPMHKPAAGMSKLVRGSGRTSRSHPATTPMC